MTCASFQPQPTGLTPAQQSVWDQRCQTALRILNRQAATAGAPDAEVLAHLRRYVRGEITLGQAIGRLLDYEARRQLAHRAVAYSPAAS